MRGSVSNGPKKKNVIFSTVYGHCLRESAVAFLSYPPFQFFFSFFLFCFPTKVKYQVEGLRLTAGTSRQFCAGTTPRFDLVNLKKMRYDWSVWIIPVLDSASDWTTEIFTSTTTFPVMFRCQGIENEIYQARKCSQSLG